MREGEKEKKRKRGLEIELTGEKATCNLVKRDSAR